MQISKELKYFLKKHDINYEIKEGNIYIPGSLDLSRCSFGTNNYLENNKDKYKDKMTLQEVLTATEGQYGHTTFKEFFKAQRA